MEPKHILIVTLGTGTNGKNYSETVYQYKDITVKSRYVMEAEIAVFQPETVMIIGTAESAWEELLFYYRQRYAPEYENSLTEEDCLALRDRLENFRGTSAADPLEMTPLLEEALQKLCGKGCFSRVKNIRPIPVRFGITQEEQYQNYAILSGRIKALLRENTDYSIAFDITHSFRSLPIYDLVSLEYLRCVLPTDLEISHIFYGCFELAHEKGTAPVVDIGSLVQVLRMTQAVEEFRHTGRVDTLIRCLPNASLPLRKALEAFDWAMQSNSAVEINQSVDELLKVLESKKERQLPLYSDACSMLLDVFQGDLLHAPEDTANLSEYWNHLDSKPFPRAYREILICRWHIKANRYGQTALIAHEALRSLLVQWYLRIKGLPQNFQNISNENYRRSAMQWLTRQSKLFLTLSDRSKEQDLLCALEAKRMACHDLRNRFAHILPTKPTEDEKKALEEFCSLLEMIVNLPLCQLEKLYSAYSQTNSRAPRVNNIKVCSGRIVFCMDKEITDEQLLALFGKSNHKKYRVFVLSDKLIQWLSSMPPVEKAAAFLTEIALDKELQSASEIILYYLHGKEMLYMFSLLSRLNCKNVKYYPPVMERNYVDLSEYSENSELEKPFFTKALRELLPKG